MAEYDVFNPNYTWGKQRHELTELRVRMNVEVLEKLDNPIGSRSDRVEFRKTRVSTPEIADIVRYINRSDTPKVRSLSFAGSSIGDKAIAELVKLKDVKILYLDKTGLTDKGIAELVGSPMATKQLRGLTVAQNPDVSEDGLRKVIKLDNLKMIGMGKPKDMSADDFAAMQEELGDRLATPAKKTSVQMGATASTRQVERGQPRNR